MRHSPRRLTSGFTLTELAIVLAVVGVLVAGLYNLISGANQQSRDSAAANEQKQLISAVKAYLASSEGTNTFLATIGQNSFQTLPLPSTLADAAGTGAACTGDANMKGPPGQAIPPGAPGFCNFLPPGFWSGTTNSYGQSYNIRVLKDNTAAGSPPTTYSFLIMTSGGNVIPDTSGARISSLIGGDGGFIYSNATGVCGTPVNHFACGSYGAWSVDINAAGSYGFAYPATGGYIASRTYVSPEEIVGNEFLARVQMPDFGSTRALNSMTVPEYLGRNELNMGAYDSVLMAGTSVYPAPAAGSATGGGWINMEGGTINFGYLANPGTNPAPTNGTMNVQGGTINLGGGQITGVGTSNINLTGDATTNNAMLLVHNPNTCTMTAPNVPATCPFAIDATTVNVVNLLQAAALYAGTFIYNASDMRLKKNIHPISNTLSDIMQLNPVSFVFKSNDKEGLGFIAQDVEKIYPQLVVPGSGGMKAVNYEGLIAPLVASVQQLKKENDELRRQIHSQEVQQEKLERELKGHSDQ